MFLIHLQDSVFFERECTCTIKFIKKMLSAQMTNRSPHSWICFTFFTKSFMRSVMCSEFQVDLIMACALAFDSPWIKAYSLHQASFLSSSVQSLISWRLISPSAFVLSCSLLNLSVSSTFSSASFRITISGTGRFLDLGIMYCPCYVASMSQRK